MLACPVVPLSQDNKGTSVPLSQKIALSRPVGNPSLDLCYGKLLFIFQIEKIVLFFLFEIQKMVFHSLDLNPSALLWEQFVNISTQSHYIEVVQGGIFSRAIHN